MEESLNESPSEKEGKCCALAGRVRRTLPSMKVPPKRKGNDGSAALAAGPFSTLNESPSEKEGKSYAAPMMP